MVTDWRGYVRTATERLAVAGVPDAAFDVGCLMEEIGGMPHGVLPDDRPLSAGALERLETALAERIAGRPLQYILGTWDFLALRLAVGEGVLIPRQDTELLCETAAAALKHMVCDGLPQVLDLCAGSGCVGLGIASLVPAEVTAVEKSPAAFRFLQENCRRYPALQVKPFAGDICTDADRFADGVQAIVSNPPYIPAAELPALMREVRREPAMALDGGEDGLLFYRVLTEKWVKKLVPGGFLAVEIGFDQGEKVNNLFGGAGLVRRRIIQDFAGKDRVVIGYRG